MNPTAARVPARLLAGLLVWLAAAAALVAAGVLERVPPPLFLIGLTALASAAAWSAPGLRAWWRAVDPRMLLLPHLVRYVGAHLLALVRDGRLPPMFAAIGWGDLAAAAGATLLLLVGPWRVPRDARWWAWLGWSLFGLGDMALLVARAVPAVLADPGQFGPFLTLPMGMLPTFVVPLVITTHLLILGRLLSSGRADRP